MVPWGDVIVNAPKIANGAMKLWSTVARKSGTADSTGANMHTAAPADAQSLDVLKAQLAASEARISELHSQMLESTELIKALADQSALLIKRIEMNRIRVLWLSVVVVILMVMMTTILYITITG